MKAKDKILKQLAADGQVTIELVTAHNLDDDVVMEGTAPSSNEWDAAWKLVQSGHAVIVSDTEAHQDKKHFKERVRTIVLEPGFRWGVLKKARGMAGLSQAAVAFSAQISAESLRLLEGGRGNPSLGTLASIARACHFSLTEIVAALEGEAPLRRTSPAPGNNTDTRRVVQVTWDADDIEDALEQSGVEVIKGSVSLSTGSVWSGKWREDGEVKHGRVARVNKFGISPMVAVAPGFDLCWMSRRRRVEVTDEFGEWVARKP